MNIIPLGAVLITPGEDKRRKVPAKLIQAPYHLRPVLPDAGQTLEIN